MTGFEVLDTVTGSATLEEIGRTLDRMWSIHDHVPEPVRNQVAIAVGEIGANIIEHAARGERVPLRMEVRVLSGEVHVVFTDHGSPAEIDLAAAAMPHEMAERGRGLALAHAAVDRIAYCRDVVNRWTLVSKRFA